MDAVEGVEHLGPELQPEPLPRAEIFRQRQVPVVDRAITNRVDETRRVAVGVTGRLLEGVGIEPAVDGSIVRRQPRARLDVRELPGGE